MVDLQERNMRAGVKMFTGIVGLSTAMDVAYRNLDEHRNHIEGLKLYMIKELQNTIPGVEFNGLSREIDQSLYTVLNVMFPTTEIGEMLLYNLDIMGIACSGGVLVLLEVIWVPMC